MIWSFESFNVIGQLLEDIPEAAEAYVA